MRPSTGVRRCWSPRPSPSQNAPILIKLHHSLTHSDTFASVKRKTVSRKPEEYIFSLFAELGVGGRGVPLGGRCRRSTVCAKQFNTLRHFCLFFFCCAGEKSARDDAEVIKECKCMWFFFSLCSVCAFFPSFAARFFLCVQLRS